MYHTDDLTNIKDDQREQEETWAEFQLWEWLYASQALTVQYT